MKEDVIKEFKKINKKLDNQLVIVLNSFMFDKKEEMCECFLPIEYKEMFENPIIKPYFSKQIYSRPFFIPRIGKNFDLNFKGYKKLICNKAYNPQNMSKKEFIELRNQGSNLPILFSLEMPCKLFEILFTNKQHILEIDANWLEKFMIYSSYSI